MLRQEKAAGRNSKRPFSIYPLNYLQRATLKQNFKNGNGNMKLANGYAEIITEALEHDCVDAVWTHFSDHEKKHFVLPDGRADIIITFIVESDGSIKNTIPIIATPYTRPRHTEIQSNQGFIGVRLKPGVMRNFLKLPQRITYSGVLRGENAVPYLRNGNELKFACKSISSLLLELNRYIFSARFVRTSSLVPDALKIIDDSKGQATVTQIVKLTGSCERTLRRNFQQFVGLSPKAYAATVRFHNALNLLSSDLEQMVFIAAECGYSDQAHMIRDFKCFTGHTPFAFRGKQQESLLVS